MWHIGPLPVFIGWTFLSTFNNQALLVGINLQGKGLCLSLVRECCSRRSLLGDSDLGLREAPFSTNGINYGG